MEQNPAISNNDEIDLSELKRILLRRKKFFVFSFGILFSFQVVFTIYQRIFNPVYKGTFKLLINDPLNQGKDSSLNESPMIESLARNTTDNDIPTLIELLKSPVILSSLSKKYDISQEEFNKNIIIKSGGLDRRDKRAEGILIINYFGDNKNDSLSLINDLSNIYLRTALNQRRQKLKDGLDFLSEQAPELENKVADLQTELSIFREENSIIEPNIEGLEIKKIQKEFDVEIMRLKSDRIRFEEVLVGLKNGNLNVLNFQQVIDSNAKSTSKSTGLSIGYADQGLLNELLELQNVLAQAKSKYQPESKMIKSLESRLEQLKKTFSKNQIETVETALKINESSINSLISQREMLNDSFSKQPQLIKEYQSIEQKLTIAQENLSSLIAARENFQLEMAQNSVPWKIIEKPFMYDKPIKPSLKRNFALAIIYSGLLSLLFAFIRDKFDHVFHSSLEIEEELKFPILANIPFVNNFEGVRESKKSFLENLENISNNNSNELSDKEKYQRFFYQESLRSLYTSIRFLGSDEQYKIIEVTSSIPSEGKSLINLLLSKTLSELGKKVLLIDADLRKPIIHQRLKLNNIVGLSNLLTDSKIKVSDVSQKVKGFNNWFVITSGTKVPDPTLLLSSERMREINKNLKESDDFDLIIYDAPPVVGLSDSLLISENTDGVILVVSLNNVDRTFPKKTLQKLRSGGSKVLGIVTNNNIKEEENIMGDNDYTYATYASYSDETNSNLIKSEESLLIKIKNKLKKLFDN